MIPVWHLQASSVQNAHIHSSSLPDNCSFDQAALAEPLSVLIHAARRAGLSTSAPSTVLVFGVGAIGLLACALAKSYGATHVVAIDINKARLDFAKEQGFAQETYCLPAADKAKTTDDQLRRAKENITAALAHFDMPDGFDVVFECTGAEPCIQMSIHVSPCVTSTFGINLTDLRPLSPSNFFSRPQPLAAKSCS